LENLKPIEKNIVLPTDAELSSFVYSCISQDLKDELDSIDDIKESIRSLIEEYVNLNQSTACESIAQNNEKETP
jgi:hypothetical protein